MKFIHRLGYYLGGFAIGLILLAFFLSGKRTSCDYGPNARTIKNITTKKLVLDADMDQRLQELSLDTLQLKSVLKVGSVDFSESDTDRDSCNLYVIDSYFKEQKIRLNVENCSKTAKLVSINKQ